MLGHMVLQWLSRNHDFVVSGTQAENPKAPDYFNAQTSAFNFDAYDYIINCIGILAPIKNTPFASQVNALFPHILARAARGRIIHMSTDGVFRGAKDSYTEDDPQDCIDVYGETKSLGEVESSRVINIRTSIIGPSPFRKLGLLEWFLAQPDGATISGYTNHIGHGVTTSQFAQLCSKIYEQDVFEALRSESSVFHFAPNTPCTKYELLCMLQEIFKKDIMIHPVPDPRGSVTRVLHSNYAGLKKIFPHGIPMNQALRELIRYC